jgi:hypothetical protein
MDSPSCLLHIVFSCPEPFSGSAAAWNGCPWEGLCRPRDDSSIFDKGIRRQSLSEDLTQGFPDGLIVMTHSLLSIYTDALHSQ